MPKGKYDWTLFSILFLYLSYTFYGDPGGAVATFILGLFIYCSYLSVNWLIRRVACHG